MTYEELLDKANEEGIEIFENNYIGKMKGLYLDETITLNSNLENDKERRCVLAEELGHYYKTYGDIRDQTKIENRKQERIARAWGYRKTVGIIDLVKAFKHGVRNRFELAEYLDVTEKYIEEVLKYYSQKYGQYFVIDNYAVYFDPLVIIEVWE